MEPNASEPAQAQPSPAPNPEKVRAAQELIGGILQRMGVTAELAAEDRPDGIHLAVKPSAGGEALGAGRSGVAESMAYLVNKALNRDEQGRKWIFLTVAGGPAAEALPESGEADPRTLAMAAELVQKAKRMGGVAWVGPVPGRLRGLSAALASAGARVRAEGEGIHRRLVIEVS
jgi:hypothetical protein